MGGIGLTVDIENFGTEPRAAPTDVLQAVWEHIHKTMYTYLRRPGSGETVSNYISDQHYDNMREGLNDASERHISFTFMDCAGCCSTSMTAAQHWTEWILVMERSALDKLVESRGYRITRKDPSLVSLVRGGVYYPLVNIDRRLYYTSRRAIGKPFGADDSVWCDSDSLAISSLSPKDREIVDRISVTGRCHCELCSQARKVVKPKKPRGGKEPPFDDKGMDGNTPKAEQLLTSDPAGKQLFDDAVGPLVAFTDGDWDASPEGPLEFQALRSWLLAQQAPLSIIALTGMMHYARKS